MRRFGMNILIVSESKLIGRALSNVCGLVAHISLVNIAFDLSKVPFLLEKNEYQVLIVYFPHSLLSIELLLREIRKKYEKVVFIFLASFLDERVKCRLEEIGVDYILDLANEFETIIPILEKTILSKVG